MAHLYGWWDRTAWGKAMVNRLTEEKVTFAGPCDADGQRPWRGGRHYVRFDYTHNGSRYPVIAEERPQFFQRRSDKPPLLIDHEASARAWRRANDDSRPYPPYGLWRNADTCVIDALLCRNTQGTTKYVMARGGWLNNAWDSHYYRLYSGSTYSKSVADEDIAPCLLDPEAAAPAPWRFHRAGGEVGPAYLDQRESQRLGRPTGFEEHAPHMATEDYARVLFPSYADYEIEPHWDPAGRMDLGYLAIRYADSEVTALLDSTTHITSDRAVWPFATIEAIDVAADDAGLGDRLTGESGRTLLGREYRRAKHSLWRRLTEALIDGWTAWPGDQAVMPYRKGPSAAGRTRFGKGLCRGEPLPPGDKLTIKHGYLGGILAEGLELHVSRDIPCERMFDY